jgi:hypothetical protein
MMKQGTWLLRAKAVGAALIRWAGRYYRWGVDARELVGQVTRIRWPSGGHPLPGSCDPQRRCGHGDG